MHLLRGMVYRPEGQQAGFSSKHHLRGWCIMMRALGMAKRLPLAPAASSTVAVLAQSPSAIVHTSGLIASIVSRSAMTE